MRIADKKRFFVLGVGRSGRAVSELLARRDFSVVVFDDNPDTIESYVMDSKEASSGARVRVVEKGEEFDALSQCDALIVSPGISLDHSIVERARREGIAITGEIEVAFQFCSSRILAVTGTNGKSTVVNILGGILRLTEQKSVVAGNIGVPFSAVLDSGEKIDTVVLEISSFQLDTISDFRADIAVLLNVTPDHLDRYDNSFEKYAASKARILNGADEDMWFVYNDEDAVCRRLVNGFPGRKIPFSSAKTLGEGVYVKGGDIVRRWAGAVETIMPRSEFSPMGVHNLENALAAVAAVIPLSIERSIIRSALREYRPLPHRMELVRVVGGVAYVNDSKATNVDATVKSVRSVEGQIVLIMGGLDKNGDFRPLLDHLDRVKNVIVMGKAAGKIKGVLAGRCAIEEAPNMRSAVGAASRSAAPGDTVLLAPGCASFDMFKDYADRGEAFRAAVRELSG